MGDWGCMVDDGFKCTQSYETREEAEACASRCRGVLVERVNGAWVPVCGLLRNVGRHVFMPVKSADNTRIIGRACVECGIKEGKVGSNRTSS